ncbi:MAG: ABC transporter ATP-binding protein [Spirochaetes bacterium]|nr:ABC transporter ATP-binding protein [Spirochaetota bacterium]
MKLTLEGIDFYYQNKKILQNICFQVKNNEIFSILGPNGAGKTTLLRCINRIIKPQKGTIFIEEKDLTQLSQLEIAREISYVAQSANPCRLTAFDAILMGRRPYIEWKICDKDLKMVHSIIQRLALEKLALQYVDNMSGGEFQKVCIARALVQEPEIILLDEPTSSLDLKNQQSILNLIKLIVETHDVSAIMSVHDINTALRYSDKLIFLKNGKILTVIPPEEVTPDIIEEVYEVKVNIHEFEDYHHVIPV